SRLLTTLHPFPTRRSSDLVAVHVLEEEANEVDDLKIEPLAVLFAGGEDGGIVGRDDHDARADAILRITILDAVAPTVRAAFPSRSEEHTSELQSLRHLVCR